MKPLVVDLFCGLGGWSKGFLAEGYRAVGFDVERHDYGSGGYPGQLVLQDVLTLHGSQFRDAACIVASPPCQRYSYMAMPWTRSKALIAWHQESPERVKDLNALFDACFRIQIEASKAAGRYIPMVVENVKGAQPWVGRAKAHYGSYYLWGDLEDVGGRIVASGPLRFGMPSVKAGRVLKGPGGDWFADGRQGQDACASALATKNSGGSWFNIAHNTESGVANNPVSIPLGFKVPGMNFHDHEKGLPGRSFQSAAVKGMSGLHGLSHPDGNGGRDLGGPNDPRRFASKSNARKAASAAIAEVPFELASHIARCFKP